MQTALGYILFIGIMLIIVVAGYFLMAKIDRFIEENRKAHQREEDNETQENDKR